MKIILTSITFSISIIFISWVVALLFNAFLQTTSFYERKLSNLNFIKNENLNKFIGVGTIKWIIKNTPFKFFNQKLKIDRRINFLELKQLRAEMTKSEIDHLIAFLFVIIFALIAIFNHKYISVLIIMIFNVLMNLYPSLLQQLNKRRIDKLILKMKS